MSDTEKSASSNNKFLKGTLILTVSSIVVKVIGSLNWIILSRVLGGEGIGLYQMGFPIYLMAKKGNIDEQMMYNTFNMGIGMVLAVDPEDVDAAMKAIRSTGDTPYVIGHIENGEKGVQLC